MAMRSIRLVDSVARAGREAGQARYLVKFVGSWGHEGEKWKMCLRIWQGTTQEPIYSRASILIDKMNSPKSWGHYVDFVYLRNFTVI